MTDTAQPSSGSSGWVDHIPVLWFEPTGDRTPRRLVLFLPGLTGTKEGVSPYLQELAEAGCVAVGFDPWQHGERGNGSPKQIAERVFGNFRRHMWPILGQTTLDTLRVFDWAVDRFGISGPLAMGGISMGGDISIAAAGLDHRIGRVADGVLRFKEAMQTAYPDAAARIAVQIVPGMGHRAEREQWWPQALAHLVGE